jgi:membrane-bound lytic murein transglycosylase B
MCLFARELDPLSIGPIKNGVKTPMKSPRRQLLLGCAGSLLAGALAPARVWAQPNEPLPGLEETLKNRLRFGWLGRSDVQEFISEISDRNGLTRPWVEKQFQGLGVQPRALLLINPPPPKPGSPERKRSWTRYLSQHADASRIKDGRVFLEQHRKVFESVHRQSGVPPHVIAAIIGVETRFGKYTGRFPTAETLATLAFESPRRGEFFRRELENLLIMGREGIVNLQEVRGSFAGALGLPQFMPSSWRSYAVGYRQKNKADLLNNPHDAIASVGNFLKVHGWSPDTPSHTLAIVPNHLNVAPFIAPQLAPVHTVDQLHQAGIQQQFMVLAHDTMASLIDLPEEDDSVKYWFAANNFFVITQYNRSFMYAAAVLTLAQSLA